MSAQQFLSNKRKDLPEDEDKIEINDEDTKRLKHPNRNTTDSEKNGKLTNTQSVIYNVQILSANLYQTASFIIPNAFNPSKNNIKNLKPPNQPTIALIIPEDQLFLLKAPTLNKIMTYHHKIKIKEKSVVNNRLYLVPSSEEDMEELLRTDSTFLPGIPRKILNDKYHSIVAFNVSFKEITSDSKIQDALTQRGVVCWEPLRKKHPENRSVKLHFIDRIKTSQFLKNFCVDNLRVLTNNYESLEIRFEPDLPSPEQCYNCYALGHVKEQCSHE